MLPESGARPEYLGAFREIVARIERALAGSPRRSLPLKMYVAGGAAMHLYTGERVSEDIDAVFSRRVSLPENLEVAYRDADGAARLLYFDRQYNDTLGLLHEDAHDDSIVLELSWRDASFWLTGDIGKAVERGLPPRMRLAPLRVIKVPHHGSLTSSTSDFVRAIRPTIAVVSAGRSNHFGHPAAEVLQRYRDAGTEIFRTDMDGEVTVDTDGYSIDVRAFTGRKIHLVYTPAYHEDTKITKP